MEYPFIFYWDYFQKFRQALVPVFEEGLGLATAGEGEVILDELPQEDLLGKAAH